MPVSAASVSAASREPAQVKVRLAPSAAKRRTITAPIPRLPPSFYAAFGSKAGLYARTLGHYAEIQGVPLGEILRPGRPVAEALAALLEESARRYGADPDATGCLAIEESRCHDPAAREAARALTEAAQDTIRLFIAATDPAAAGLCDYVVTMMVGLSTMARAGHGPDRLLATARFASRAIAQALATDA